MQQSEQINELATALAIAQTTIQRALKDSTNPHFKSKYADISSVWATWQDVGPSNGLAVTQFTTMTDSGVTVLCTQIIHKSGQWIRGVYPLIPIKNDPQGMGSAMTYARRYCLAAMVGICPEDDDGNAALDKTEPAPKITLAQISELTELADRTGSKINDMCAAYKVNALSSMTVEQYTACKVQLNRKADKIAEAANADTQP